MAITVALPFSDAIVHTLAVGNSTPTPVSTGILPTPSSTPPDPTPTARPVRWTEINGITYATLPFGTYKLNIYTPNPPPSGNTPIVLYFHGCCNPDTNRNNALRLGQTPMDPHEYVFRLLLYNGYQVATLDYPAEYPIVNKNDAIAGKSAVRFLRANAAQYHINPKRIIAWGSSGGGHPAVILGTADKSAGLDKGQYLHYSSRVEAVLQWYGTISLQYITSDDAPFVIQQGDEDNGPAKKDSLELLNALLAVNVVAQLQYVAHAGHQFEPTGGEPNPDYEDIAKTAVSFLNAEVRDNPNPEPQ